MFKILLLAPNCDGEDVGEAWVGFQWARHLSAVHDVTLLTQCKYGKRPVSEQLTGLRIKEWMEPAILGRAERLNSMLKPGYLLFYLKARRWIRDSLARGEKFDIAFQPVPVAMRYPSPVYRLGVPYVLGPVGGSLDSPPSFDDADTAPWYVGLRKLDRWRMKWDPLLTRTYDGAACVLGIAPYVQQFLKNRSLQRFEIMSETGIEGLPKPTDRSTRAGPTRLLYVGRLIRTKGVRDAIRALGWLRDLSITFDIVGDGFDRATCETVVSDLNLRDRVVFHGWLPREQIEDFYRNADIFLFPSYREPGGNVAFEAMAHGLPLVVCNRGGPASAADDSCSIRLSAVSPDQYAEDIAKAVRRLAENQPLRLELGMAARRRVDSIAIWHRKIDRINDLFAEIVGEADPPRPYITGAPLRETLPL